MVVSKQLVIFFSILILGIYSQCPLGCVSCHEPTTCIECDIGFFLVDSTFCAPCPPGCSTCYQGDTGLPVCDSCIAPYNINSNNRCFLCDPSCLTCQNQPRNCLSCREGKQLSTTGACTDIEGCSISNCAACVTTDYTGAVECESCLNGYFAFKKNCFPCKFPCASCNLNWEDLWTSTVSSTTIQLIRLAYNVSGFVPPSGFFPSVVNDLDFSSMNETFKRGWTEAFFVFNAIRSSVPNPDALILSIPSHINFFVTNMNQSQAVLQSMILNRVNGIVGKNWTLAQFTKKVGQSASTFTNCTQCSVGFSVTSSSVDPCQRCPIGCSQCSAGVCSSCINGTYLDSGSCLPCTPPCATCQTSATTCTSCIAPTSLSSTSTCILCTDPCATCLASNVNTCITCKQPYSFYADPTGTCYRCNQDLCVQCDATNSSICFQCKQGASLNAGRCQLCSGNCSSCVNIGTTSTCFECAKGFQLKFLSVPTCVACGAGCVSCSAGACQQCLPGSFLSLQNATCLKCKPGCKQCSNYQICNVFENGVIIIDDKAITCRVGCKVCDTPQTCVQCEDRYFLTTDSVCRPCEAGCDKCSSPTVCTKCSPNLRLSSGNCIACLGNCRTCSTSNASQCTSCKRGYSLIGVECLHQCNQGCLQCDPTNSTKCIICQQGYALRIDGRCTKCPGACSGNCDPRNISICLGCVDGFQLKDNQCVRCPPGCATCLNGQCSLCVDGFVLNQTSNGYFICSQKCRAPCTSCSSQSCFKCQQGFTLVEGHCNPDLTCNPNCQYCPVGTQKDNTGTCVICPLNCSTCVNSVCYQCLPGNYLNSSSICTPCPQKCKTCYNQNSCDQCALGYVKQISSMTSTISDAVFSDQCIACDSNCKTCIVEPTRCTSCVEGMRLKSHRCAGVFTVVYVYQIDLPYATFLENSQSDSFIDTISAMINVSSIDNYINYVKQGSTVVSGTISSSSQSSASSVQSSLASSTPAGYTILSSSATVYYGDSPYQQIKPEEQAAKTAAESTNIGLIIGAAAGGVLIIGVTIFIVYRVKCKKQMIHVQPSSEIRNKQDNFYAQGLSEARKKQEISMAHFKNQSAKFQITNN